MSRKIIGITVGSPLPKPNLKQDDPTKGDYVKGKDIIPTKVSQLENDSNYVGTSELQPAVNNALEQAKTSGEFKGDKGDKGDTGDTGAAGADGYTPVKGVDYFTEEDKTEMVNAVLAALPSAEEVAF